MKRRTLLDTATLCGRQAKPYIRPLPSRHGEIVDVALALVNGRISTVQAGIALGCSKQNALSRLSVQLRAAVRLGEIEIIDRRRA